MANNTPLPPHLFDTLPWNPEPHAIWMGAIFTLRRNLSRFNFPSKLIGQDAEQLINSLKKALMTGKDVNNPQFFSLRELSSLDRELLFEHFLFLQGLQEPPHLSAFVLNDAADILALINTHNHLDLYALSPSPSWENTWQKLNGIETQLSSSLGFAYLPKFGYLTSDPSQAGTGLSVTIFLHLPALIHAGQIESALQNVQDPDVQFMGFSGDLDGLVGDLIILQNNYSLGVSEEGIFRSLQMGASKLIGAEKTMRQHFKDEPSSEIKDLISKAFGLTVHAFQLETKEALDLLSLLKLGRALGYVTQIEDRKLDELFFKCRRGYFSHLFPDIKDPKALAQKRADYFKNELKGISLQG